MYIIYICHLQSYISLQIATCRLGYSKRALYLLLRIDSSDYWSSRYLFHGLFGHVLVTIFFNLARFWPHMALSCPHFDPKWTPLTWSGPSLTNFRPFLMILWHFQFLAIGRAAIFFSRYLFRVRVTPFRWCADWPETLQKDAPRQELSSGVIFLSFRRFHLKLWPNLWNHLAWM